MNQRKKLGFVEQKDYKIENSELDENCITDQTNENL
jgi:hypothetical protein